MQKYSLEDVNEDKLSYHLSQGTGGGGGFVIARFSARIFQLRLCRFGVTSPKLKKSGKTLIHPTSGNYLKNLTRHDFYLYRQAESVS